MYSCELKKQVSLNILFDVSDSQTYSTSPCLSRLCCYWNSDSAATGSAWPSHLHDAVRPERPHPSDQWSDRGFGTGKVDGSSLGNMSPSPSALTKWVGRGVATEHSSSNGFVDQISIRVGAGKQGTKKLIFFTFQYKFIGEANTGF